MRWGIIGKKPLALHLRLALFVIKLKAVGLDMIMLPGDIKASTLAGIILDECAIGVSARKTTGVRVIPVPDAKVGDYFDFGGLFGGGTVVAPRCPDGQEAFVAHGGHIPAPIHSLLN